ncbi:ATP-binding protein [Aliiruegeria sabulilitoris]|uniref:ATP-binding protein n=1 Tax=Aliiruegeria sabulilitoris TaxID=1510458 RepID=UPI00082FF1DA|nr:ATP-binding protein [Aliiruegeria sabulilitoris]NDR58919.1 HAMP domain-containing protein [Pseudoruegeria sp. M32A2M]
MNRFRRSLALQFFAAFALTAALVVATLAGLVSFSMRDGFSRYLLQGELLRLDRLVVELSEQHDPADPGWPDLTDDPETWNRFLASNATPEDRPPNRPEIRPDMGQPGPGRKPFPPPPDAGPLRLNARIFLMSPDGTLLVPPLVPGSLSERREIPAAEGTELLGYIGLTAPRSGRSKTDLFFLRGQTQNLLLASLFAIGVSALAASLLARHLLRPIKALERGARTLTQGDFDHRIPNDREDELGQLIEHTNTLAQSLQDARDAEQRWISDTSHELQTPLAVLRAEIEAMQDGIRKADTRTLNEMHDAVMRLSRLVADLKTLSFSREGRTAVAARLTDFSDLLNLRLDHAEMRLNETGLTVEREIGEGLELHCDPDRMAQVMDNLIENTMRYTAVPGTIRLTAYQEGNEVIAIVEDTPPAPPDEAMGLLFNRFYRAEASRTRSLGGSGLGLSICSAIVAAHDGTIEADRSPLGGLRVRLALPK